MSINRNLSNTGRASLAALSVGIACVCAAMAFGPLTPPSGPVASTAKPLSEVEPRIAINATNTPGDPIGDASPSLFKITQPGSYYLTGNITGVAGKHGIEIASSGVTLDLNGFDLAGVAGMGAFDGVSVTASGLTNVEVRNGSVRNWGDEGVDLGSFGAVCSRIESVRASGNGGHGMSTGTNSLVTNCSASLNAGSGISIGSGSKVTDCTASQNTGSGISTVTGCTVTDCAARSNTQDGITVSSGSAVADCTAFLNTGNGISATNGCTVANCTARQNSLDGVVCASQCVIRGNACSLNGASAGDGAGVHATGSDNHIEGNACTGADRGIDVDAAGNFIIRNTCSGNTIDWDIVANNIYGPIIDRRIPTTVASTPSVSGFAAADSTGSTHPNANFTY